MRLSLLIFGTLCVVTITASTLEEPFLLKFGPKNGDTFVSSGLDDCSQGQNISDLRVGASIYEELFVCTNGLISFGYPYRTYWPSDLDNNNTALLAVFFGDSHLEDNFLDYMCIEGYDYHDSESSCTFFRQSNSTDVFSFFFYYDYVLDEEIRNKITKFETLEFTRSEFDLQVDDYITQVVMGKDTTKYVNLANNVFKRELSSDDLETVSSLIRGKVEDFQADWGYVATWYKIGAYWRRVDAFNSFQLVIVRDGNDSPEIEDDRVFVVFDFYELQWTYSRDQPFSVARSGIADGKGTLVELPFSGTPEVRNLWAYTNFDIPGTWVFELKQDDSQPGIVPAGELDVGGLSFTSICPGELTPANAPARKRHEFLITECSLPDDHKSVQLVFIGQDKNVTYDKTDYNKHAFTLGVIGVRWEFVEPVAVALKLDGVILPKFKYVNFYDLLQAPGTTNADAKKDTANGLINVSIGPDALQFPIDVLSWKQPVGGGIEISIERIESSDDDSTANTFSYPIPDDGSQFITFSHNDSAFTYPIPIENNEESTCASWNSSQSKNDYSKCVSELGKWYGCPRQVNSGRFNIEEADAWWAHREVNEGMNGWEYDICCSDNPTNREQLDDIGYCSKDECEFNKGAEFCVRSPRLACIARIGGAEKAISVSNQCCYAAGSGRLLNDSDPPESSGSMDLQRNSMDNLAPHYWSELQPYKVCCGEDSTNTCGPVYKKHRPSVIGWYLPRNLLINRGDPDIQTVDGISYPFMGLGVFTMILTSLNDTTNFQASMRRVGNGTIFSGFATTYLDTRLECYITEDGNFSMAINGHIKQLGIVSSYTLSNIAITEKQSGEDITFQFLGNQMIIRMVIVDNFLNLMISVPPTFKNNMDGLMGHYDGNTSNDFTTSDGRVVDADSDYLVIHEQFGNSWKVVDDDQWLFAVEEIKDSIKADIQNGSPFTPTYEITFATEEDKLNAQQACNNDTACMRDVSLTGNTSFAEVLNTLQNEIRISIETNEISRLNEPPWVDGNNTTDQINDQSSGGTEVTPLPDDNETDEEKEEDKSGIKPYRWAILFLVLAAVVIVGTAVVFVHVLHNKKSQNAKVSPGKNFQVEINEPEFKYEETWMYYMRNK